MQYADYAVWQRRWLSGEVLQRQSDYWQQTLAGAPALLSLPTDRPRPAQQDHQRRQRRDRAGRADQRRAQGVVSASRRDAVHGDHERLGDVCSRRLSGQSDVVIGSPVANRTRAEIEGLIGMFVNTLALRIDTSGELSGEALAGAGQGANPAGAGASGPAVRARGGHLQTAAQPVPQRVVPDPVELGQQRWRRVLTLGDLTLEGVAGAGHFVKFDLSLTLGAHRRRDSRCAALRHGVVR